MEKKERWYFVLVTVVFFLVAGFLIDGGNVLTGAVIGTQGDVIGIEAAQVGTLGDFYDDFALTPNTTHWYNSTANGGELGWDGSAMNFTAKVTAALPTINFISLENISMASFNLSANITLDNTSATLTEANSHSAISIGVYNNTASGVNSYCSLTIDNSGSFNLHFYNDSGANFLANSTSVNLGPNTNGDILLNFEFNNVTNMVNCSYGTPSGFISITAPTSYIGSDYGVFAYGSTYIIGPGNPTGDLNASIKTFNYTIDVIPETLQDCATITSDTIMDQNVTIDGTCFIAGASDITLDCAGYEINYSNAGTFGYGVNITGYDNVTVKNCIIKEGSATGNGKQAIYGNDANTTIFNNTVTMIGTQSVAFKFGSSSSLGNISANTVTCVGGCGALTLGGTELYVFNNFVNLTGGSQARGFDIPSAEDSNISQNTVVVDSTTSNGIYVGGSRNLITNNTVTGSGTSAEGIFAYDNAENNTFSENVVNLTGSGSEALGVNKLSGGNPEGNIFLNNNVTALAYGFHDELNGTNNTLMYNNSFGLINWTKTNLTTQVNLTMDVNIFLENGSIGFQHEDQDGSGEQLNATAQLRFVNLNAQPPTPYLLKDGVRCDNTDSCNISFDDVNYILYANVSSFSNYTMQRVPSPNVTTLVPAENTAFNSTNLIEISMNITIDASDYRAIANITYPNGTIETLELANGTGHDNKFNGSFDAPNVTGTFNITFIANNSVNDPNASETSNFSVTDLISPVITINGPYEPSNGTSVVLNISTSEPGTCQYKNSSSSYADFGTTGDLEHNQTLTNLPAGSHTYTFSCNDSSGNTPELSMVILVTTGTFDNNYTDLINTTANVTTTYETISRLNVTFNLSKTFSTNFTLTVQEYNDSPETAAFSRTGYTVKELKYYTIDAPAAIGNINKITFNFDYDETDIAAAGITEADLVVYYYNSTANSWTLESESQVDTTANTIEVNVTHLSTFILGTASEDSTTTTTTTSSSSGSSSSGGGSSLPPKDENVTDMNLTGNSVKVTPAKIVDAQKKDEGLSKELYDFFSFNEESGSKNLWMMLKNLGGYGVSRFMILVALGFLFVVVLIGAGLHKRHHRMN